MEAEVLVEERAGWGILTLNRPKALNALNSNMCNLLLEQLTAWLDAPSIKAVLIKGAGEKAFCAGGDIRWMYERSQVEPATTYGFFRTEYTLNSLIYHYPKPYVALMHGVIMGGGVGVSISASTRIVGENIIWAMPETAIGMVPDIGGSYFLPRFEGGLGAFLGLTGHRLNGGDALYAGIASHVVPEEKFDRLEKALLGVGETALTQSAIDDCAASFGVDSVPGLAKNRQQIDEYFSDIHSIEALMIALAADEGEFAETTLKTLRRMSPISLKITLEAIRRGRDMTLDECLKMEFDIVSRVMEGPDFHEGVRAQIIDKDRNPIWSPPELEAISQHQVDKYFSGLENEALSIEHKLLAQN